MANRYKENGFESRKDYFEYLEDMYGIDFDTIVVLADMLGPNEDFDGLVSSLQDYC